MLTKIRDASKSFRKSFGNFGGLILWASLLREKICRKGQLFSVRVPGLRHPVYLRAHTSDTDVFCQIFGGAELDIAFQEDVKYVIDAGANISLASLFFANRYPNANIDALEIDDENLRMLRLNTEHYKKIRVVAKGLWSHSTHLKILNPEAESWTFRVVSCDQHDLAGIPATGILELMEDSNQTRVDILKIDIEGSEFEVFSSGTYKWIANVRTLMVELHDRFKPGCTQAFTDAISIRPNSTSRSGEYHVVVFQAD